MSGGIFSTARCIFFFRLPVRFSGVFSGFRVSEERMYEQTRPSATLLSRVTIITVERDFVQYLVRFLLLFHFRSFLLGQCPRALFKFVRERQEREVHEALLRSNRFQTLNGTNRNGRYVVNTFFLWLAPNIRSRGLGTPFTDSPSNSCLSTGEQKPLFCTSSLFASLSLSVPSEGVRASTCLPI